MSAPFRNARTYLQTLCFLSLLPIIGLSIPSCLLPAGIPREILNSACRCPNKGENKGKKEGEKMGSKGEEGEKGEKEKERGKERANEIVSQER